MDAKLGGGTPRSFVAPSWNNDPCCILSAPPPPCPDMLEFLARRRRRVESASRKAPPLASLSPPHAAVLPCQRKNKWIDIGTILPPKGCNSPHSVLFPLRRTIRPSSPPRLVIFGSTYRDHVLPFASLGDQVPVDRVHVAERGVLLETDGAPHDGR